MRLVELRGCLYDTRVKLVNGQAVEILQAKYPVFNPEGLEVPRKRHKYKGKSADEEDNKPSGDDRAVRRARKRVYDLAVCNDDLKYFITLTLDKEKIDRYDYSVIVSKLNTWLDNAVRRKGLKYVLVCETHKDGAIHFHGLINDVFTMIDSGKYTISCGKKKPIYNIKEWKYGFTTAIEVTGEHSNVCKYISKYITKQNVNGKAGGRWYYHGGDLKEPEYLYSNTYYEKLSIDGVVNIFEYSPESAYNEYRTYVLGSEFGHGTERLCET